jgi:hypothetical protein
LSPPSGFGVDVDVRVGVRLGGYVTEGDGVAVAVADGVAVGT